MANWTMCQRLPDWDNGCECWNIQFEGMDRPTTVMRQPFETVEQLIERTRAKWSARDERRENGLENIAIDL